MSHSDVDVVELQSLYESRHDRVYTDVTRFFGDGKWPRFFEAEIMQYMIASFRVFHEGREPVQHIAGRILVHADFLEHVFSQLSARFRHWLAALRWDRSQAIIQHQSAELGVPFEPTPFPPYEYWCF
jgi:hypothetical protein